MKLFRSNLDEDFHNIYDINKNPSKWYDYERDHLKEQLRKYPEQRSILIKRDLENYRRAIRVSMELNIQSIINEPEELDK